MSPETFNYSYTEGIDGESVDIWALGVTLFCFTFMELPFYHEDFEELRDCILKKE